MNENKEKQLIIPWRILKSKLVFDSEWAKVRRDKCELPNGRVIDDYYYWEGGDFSQVFAITPKNQVVLTRQYKHGVKEIVTELPAGLIDANDESPLNAAKRELKEETGYTGENWLQIGRLNISSAKSTARAYIFITQQATKREAPHPDKNEIIEVLLIDINKIVNLIERGVICDASSVTGIFLALRNLGL
jgi:8-oxo-dGTP pyrophosphatase MutT (NUDIX family)